MTTIDLSFLKGNPVYILVGFVIFYLVIAQPFFKLDLIRSILLFALLYVLFKKYGDKAMDKLKTVTKSSLGRNN